MRAHNSELRAADEQETKRGRKKRNREFKSKRKKEAERGIQIDIVIPRRQSYQQDSSDFKELIHLFSPLDSLLSTANKM